MAPGILIQIPISDDGNSLKRAPNEEAPRSIFPDGIRTSGQHPPLYDALKHYTDFPREITGPTVWKRETYSDNPERWTHAFTDEEVQEISDAADQFIQRGTPLTGITKVHLSTISRSGMAANV